MLIQIIKDIRQQLFLLVLLISSSTFGTTSNLAGNLDTTFGTGGIVTIPLIIRSNLILDDHQRTPDLRDGVRSSVAIDAQRRPVICVSQLGFFKIIRLVENGSLDQTFGTGGTVETRIPDRTGVRPQGLVVSSEVVAIDRQGRILVAGFILSSDEGVPGDPIVDCIVARYLYDGSLDQTFGTGGIARLGLDRLNTAVSTMAVDLQDRIVLAGGSKRTGDPNVRACIVRVLPTGKLDTSFGGKGRGFILQKFSNNADPNKAVGDIAEVVKIDPYGRIVVVGTSCVTDESFNPPQSQYEIVIVRYTPDGFLDTTFGMRKQGLSSKLDRTGMTKFKVTNLPSERHNGGGHDFVFDKLQRIIVGGVVDYTVFKLSIVDRFDYTILARLIQDGDIDRNFGLRSQNGFPISKFPVSSTTWGIILDAREKIVVAGDWRVLNIPDQNDPTTFYFDTGFVISRFTPDGILDTTFGPNKTGQVINQLTTRFLVHAGGLAMDASGRIIVFGTAGNIIPANENDVFVDGEKTIKLFIARYTGDYELLFRDNQASSLT